MDKFCGILVTAEYPEGGEQRCTETKFYGTDQKAPFVIGKQKTVAHLVIPAPAQVNSEHLKLSFLDEADDQEEEKEKKQ